MIELIDRLMLLDMIMNVILIVMISRNVLLMSSLVSICIEKKFVYIMDLKLNSVMNSMIVMMIGSVCGLVRWLRKWVIVVLFWWWWCVIVWKVVVVMCVGLVVCVLCLIGLVL